MASGCKVTTGWIDYHVHYFNHGTENGINPDAASFPCGVTTAVDGGSTGAANYEMYRKSAMAYSDVRILNMLPCRNAAVSNRTATGASGKEIF